jgi:biotin transport system substrate-specific component
VIGAAGLVGLLAQVTIHLSFTPVPVTGQTLGVLLSGTALGWKRGAAAMVTYGTLGVLGVPWFANHASGYVGASFGYVIGFVLCAAACGFLAERGADRSVIKSLPAMIVGEVVLYLIGVVWLGFTLHVGAGEAISLGLTPFLIGDSIKAALAAVLLPSAWKLVGGRSGRRDNRGKRYS